MLHFCDVQSADGTQYEPLTIYTSTPEAVYGVAYVAVSPQHRLNQTQLYQVWNGYLYFIYIYLFIFKCSWVLFLETVLWSFIV